LVGGDGNDVFTVASNNAYLRIEAGSGDDTISLLALRAVGATSSANAFKANGLVEVVGGADTDFLQVNGTEGSDAFAVTSGAITGAGVYAVLSATEETIELDARGGNDAIFLESSRADTVLHVVGGFGSDTISLAGDVTSDIVAGEAALAKAAGSLLVDGYVTADAVDAATFAAGANAVAIPATPNAGRLVTGMTGNHLLSDMRGAVLIDAGNMTSLAFGTAIVTKGQTAVAPLALPAQVADSATSDRLVMFNDASTSATTGRLDDAAAVNGVARRRLSGFGLDSGTLVAGAAPVTYDLGLVFANFEMVELLLGSGDDTLTLAAATRPADNTAQVATTIVYGGAGADRITATAMQAASALVIYGDADPLGQRYADQAGAMTGSGHVFFTADTAGGNGDVIDVSALTLADDGIVRVMVDGGSGDDTILGSSGADLLAGGSGHDMISGAGGADILLGDGGLRYDSAARAFANVSLTQASASSGPAADAGSPGNDTLRGGAGADVLFGDFAEMTAGAGALTLGWAWKIAGVASVDAAVGGDDELDGGLGSDVMVGGTGNDLLGPKVGLADGGTDVLFGDNASVAYNLAVAVPTRLSIISTALAFGGADTLRGASDADILVGGADADSLEGQGGNNILIGDGAIITQVMAATSLAVSTVVSVASPMDGADTILANDGTNVVMGGNGADVITLGNGGNLVAGDNASFTARASAVALAAGTVFAGPGKFESTTPVEGGNDTILAGGGDNILIGGAGADSIGAGLAAGAIGRNIVLGDHGGVTYDAATALVVQAQTLFAGVGGADSLTLGDGAAIVIGGAGADVITAGNGNSVILGDIGTLTGKAQVSASGAVVMTLTGITTVAEVNGAADLIATGLGSSIILGGEGGDSITTSAADLAATGAGSNILIGDHGTLTFTNAVTGKALPATVTSALPTVGGGDVIRSGMGNDIVLGGAGADFILTGGGSNVVFGDHGSVTGTLDPVAIMATASTTVLASLNTGAAQGGGDDTLLGGAGNDLIVGGQGSDLIYGAAGDDDLIGGHYLMAAAATLPQATGSSDLGDVIDGGFGNDVLIGDSGSIKRSATDLRLRKVTGTTTVGAAAQANTEAAARAIWLYTSPTAVVATYGSDYIAGGAGSDMLFGQSGDDVVQGDGGLDLNADGIVDALQGRGVGAWTEVAAYDRFAAWSAMAKGVTNVTAKSTTGGYTLVQATTGNGSMDYAYGTLGVPTVLRGATSSLMVVKASVTDASGAGTDGDDYVEGGAGNDAIFGNGGQDDLIGGGSELFGGLIPVARTIRTIPAANLAGTDRIFGDSGALESLPQVAGPNGRAREGNVVVSGNANVLRLVNATGGVQTTVPVGAASIGMVVRRAITTLSPAATDLGAISYLVGAGAQDVVVKSALSHVTFGTAGAAQSILTKTGGSILTARVTGTLGLSNAAAAGPTDRTAPSVVRTTTVGAPVAATIAAPVSAANVAGVPVWTYSTGTKVFSSAAALQRQTSFNATNVIDLKTAPGAVFAYVDDKGGFWMVG
jgi:Ca2+-binding RTX toxin-like protein